MSGEQLSWKDSEELARHRADVFLDIQQCALSAEEDNNTSGYVEGSTTSQSRAGIISLHSALVRHSDQFGTCPTRKILIRELPGWLGSGALAVGGEADGREFVLPREEMALGRPNHSLSITTRKL